MARIILDSAPLNILDCDQCDELLEAILSIRDDDVARIVVIQGDGGEFCSGTDIAEHTPEKMPQLLPKFHSCLDAMLTLDAITIAAVEGHCLGGGLELALSCDRILVDENAKLGLPEIKLGCFPPAGWIQMLALPAVQRFEWCAPVKSAKPVISPIPGLSINWFQQHRCLRHWKTNSNLICR